MVHIQPRTPTGQLSRARDEPSRDYAPAEIRRLRDAAMTGLRDAEWGTELGLLFLEGKITAAMYGAGKWWRDMAVAYLKSINAPWPVARSAMLERRSHGTDPDPDTDEGHKRAKRDRDAIESFREAHAVLTSTGLMAVIYVRELCEYNLRPIGPEAMASVCRGLERLVQFRSLTNKDKSA